MKLTFLFLLLFNYSQQYFAIFKYFFFILNLSICYFRCYDKWNSFLNCFLDCSLWVHWNTTQYCMLTLYTTTIIVGFPSLGQNTNTHGLEGKSLIWYFKPWSADFKVEMVWWKEVAKRSYSLHGIKEPEKERKSKGRRYTWFTWSHLHNYTSRASTTYRAYSLLHIMHPWPSHVPKVPLLNILGTF